MKEVRIEWNEVIKSEVSQNGVECSGMEWLEGYGRI